MLPRRPASLFQSLMLLAAALVAAAVAAGCRSDPQKGFSSTERLGYTVFVREQCMSHCHMYGTIVGRPYNARDARSGLPPDLRKTPRRTADWYRAYLIDPGAVLPQSSMQSFDNLSGPEIEELIAFLRRLNQESVTPAPQPVSASSIPETGNGLIEYDAGRILFANNCRGCHGEWGNGAGPVGSLLSPEPRDFTDTLWMSKQSEVYLFSVVSNGKPKTAMPAFRDLLSDRERALVLRYVEYFADPVGKERMELAVTTPIR